MWKCSECDELLEDQFDLCWKCGSSKKKGQELPDDKTDEIEVPKQEESEITEHGFPKLTRPLVFDNVSLFYFAHFDNKEEDAKAKILISRDGMDIKITEILRDKYDFLGVPVEIPLKDQEVSWNDFRSLSYAEINNNQFIAHLGSGKVYHQFGIRVNNPDKQDMLKLRQILSSLPDFVKLPPCSKCGGPVKENACQTCGAKATTQARKFGFLSILGGTALIFGLAVFVFPINSIIAKFICALGGMFGVVFIGYGLYSLVSGKQ